MSKTDNATTFETLDRLIGQIRSKADLGFNRSELSNAPIEACIALLESQRPKQVPMQRTSAWGIIKDCALTVFYLDDKQANIYFETWTRDHLLADLKNIQAGPAAAKQQFIREYIDRALPQYDFKGIFTRPTLLDMCIAFPEFLAPNGGVTNSDVQKWARSAIPSGMSDAFWAGQVNTFIDIAERTANKSAVDAVLLSLQHTINNAFTHTREIRKNPNPGLVNYFASDESLTETLRRNLGPELWARLNGRTTTERNDRVVGPVFVVS